MSALANQLGLTKDSVREGKGVGEKERRRLAGGQLCLTLLKFVSPFVTFSCFWRLEGKLKV